MCINISHGRCYGCSWLRKDISNTTGLTVLEVELPTGYVIMNDDLRLYVQSGEVPTLRRAFYYSQKVVFYLDYVRILMISDR